jgi:hypothetical protein
MAEPPRAEEVIFLAAPEKATPEERTAYLDSACGGNAELRERLETLLRRHEESGGPLDLPPPGLASTPDMPPIAERPGSQIGRYKLLEEIGGRRKRGQVQFVRSTRRAVPANWTCPLFRGLPLG